MNYYNEIETYIKKNEINKRARIIKENQDILTNYWNIGKLLVEAQGGKERAKYGNELIKEWSKTYTEKYGSGYNYANLTRFRKTYLLFPILATLSQLSWSQVVELLPIKEENKRNYYINQCISKNLFVRELKKEINNNAYERLIKKPDKIEIMLPSNTMKDPIILEIGTEITREQDLEISILAKLQNFFNQLEEGFTLVDNQYKINYNNKKYYIDILLFIITN